MKKPTVRSELRSVLDEPRARAVIDHREKIKKPLTVYSAHLLALSLGSCPDANQAADLMIERGWRSVKPNWIDTQQQPRAPPPGQSMVEFMMERARRAQEEENANVIETSYVSRHHDGGG